jgi:hypothetical protein
MHTAGLTHEHVRSRSRSAAWFATGLALALLAVFTVRAWPADAAPGDNDTTFVPVNPCRLFDYRPAPDTVGTRSTPLGANIPYTQQVTGSNGNCTGPSAIPSDATAVAMNVTAVNPTAQSNLRIYPADLVTPPLVSNLNYTAGQKPVPNKVDVKLSPTGQIKLLNLNGTVSVIGDVVGYYTVSSLQQLANDLAQLRSEVAALPSSNIFAAGRLLANGTLASGSPKLGSFTVTKLGTGSYQLQLPLPACGLNAFPIVMLSLGFNETAGEVALGLGSCIATVGGSTASFSVTTTNSAGTPTDKVWQFIALGGTSGIATFGEPDPSGVAPSATRGCATTTGTTECTTD